MARHGPFFRYVRLTAVGALAMLAAAAGFNRLVDPFWYFGDPLVEGFNAVKPKIGRYERHVKPGLVQSLQPDALVLGSSFAEIGFDPQHPALAGTGGAYNFALAGSTWQQIACHYRYALEHSRPRRMVLEVHAGGYPAIDCTAQLAAMEQNPLPGLLLSSTALRAALQTVAAQGSEAPSHTRRGMYYYTRNDPGAERRFREMILQRLNGNPRCEAALKQGAPAVLPTPAFPPRPPLPEMSGLEQAVRQAVQQGIELRLVVAPVHALSAELDRLCGDAHLRWEALWAMAAAVERASGGDASVQLWDFQGYDPAITESVSAGIMRNWQDLGHFNHELGSRMLARMFGEGEPEFGVRVTTATLAARWQAFERARERYLESGADPAGEIRRILGTR